MRDSCRVCTAPLTPSGTGRPPAYCSVPCRRAAELAIKRQDRRIERLMTQADSAEVALAQYHAMTYGESHPRVQSARALLDTVRASITEAEAAMRSLMGDD